MSDKKISRRTDVEIMFDGVDISSSIRNYFISLTYLDSEDDESDDLEIRVEDRDQVWLEKWLAKAVDAAASPGGGTSGGSNTYTVTPKIGLNVRRGEGTDTKKLGALTCGTEVKVNSIKNGWAKIEYDGETAYVCANYIKESGSSTATGSASTGMSIRASIVRMNWKSDGKDDRLECGSFELDSVDAEGPPSEIIFRAAALSFKSSIRETAKSRSWEDYKLSGIAKEIASKNGMTCMFKSGYDPKYKRREQSDQSDIAFLRRLCRDAGLSLKATDQMIVIFDSAEYESKTPVMTIKRGDGSYTGWRLHVGNAQTQYQSCRVSYNDPKTGQKIEAIEKAPDYDDEDGGNRQLEIVAKVENIGEAKTLAKKRLRMANRYAKTASFTMTGNPVLVAGVTVQLENWGPWSGKYIISQSRHDVGSGGYTTSIDIRRCLDGY